MSTAISESVPDGATQKVRDLDDATRQHKIDIRERMEESLIDSAVEGWNTAGGSLSKPLIQGIARIFRSAVGARPAASRAGRLWADSAGVAADQPVLTIDDGAAWQHVPIGQLNLLTDAVITAKIKDANVTSAKLAAQAATIWRTEIAYSAADIDDATNGVWAHTAKCVTAGLTFTITPAAATSVVVCYLRGSHYQTGSGNGSVRIQKSTAGATGQKTLAVARTLQQSDTTTPQSFSLWGMFTGETAAMTIQVQVARTAATYHLDGTQQDSAGIVMPITFGAFEVLH